MPTECSSDLFGFSRVEGRSVVAAFDGGRVSSDAGALLLGAADRALGLVDRFAACFADARAPPSARRSESGCCGVRSRSTSLLAQALRPVGGPGRPSTGRNPGKP